MEKKKIGIGLIIIGIFLILVLSYFKVKLDEIADLSMELTGGECISGDGTCIHEESKALIPSIIGYSLSGVIILLGIYFSLFDREKLSNKEKPDSKFDIILSALDESEQKVLKAVREQDGIQQSTLRFRTDLSKTKLSMVLKDLEKKNLVRKTVKGKTNLVFLKRKFELDEHN
jgi:ribosomal protein S25